MSNGKVMIVLWAVVLRKKMSLYNRSYYPEPDNHVRKSVNIELDLPNYATKTEVKEYQVLIHLIYQQNQKNRYR